MGGERVYDNSGWMVETAPILGATIEPHLDWLLSRIEPTASELAALRVEGADARIDCYWSSIGMSGGPWITAKTMARLVALDLDLVVSFYAVDPDDAD